jgi:chemotaxis response regulator CheB
MTRVLVVADSGPMFARLTTAVGTVRGAYIVRHGSSASPLDRLLGALEPDVVLIGDLLAPADAPARIADVRRAAPGALVVALRSKRSPRVLAGGASAVLPADLEPTALGEALTAILAARTAPSAADMLGAAA